MDFENAHLSIISEYEMSALDIERSIFTGLYDLNSRHYSLLAIQSLSILYSYWEGFFQRSFQLYIDYINELDIDFYKLSDEIVVFHMDNSFKQFKNYPQRVKQKIAFFDKLQNHYSSEKHQLYRVINTNSNVDFSVLNRVLEQFSLEKFPEHWGIYKHPNSNLKDMLNSFIRYRNGVAHGGDVSSEEKISQEVYSKYRFLIKDLMYEIHVKFLDGIINQTFIK